MSWKRSHSGLQLRYKWAYVLYPNPKPKLCHTSIKQVLPDSGGSQVAKGAQA